MDFAEVRPERGPGPRSGEKSEKSRPESLDLGKGNMYILRIKSGLSTNKSPALVGRRRKLFVIQTIPEMLKEKNYMKRPTCVKIKS